jgi:polar amino acid transport system permease protein
MAFLFDDGRRSVSRGARALSFALALALFAGVCSGAFYFLSYQWAWRPVFGYWRLFWQGWLATLGLAGLALPLSCMVGLVSAAARRSGFLPLSYAARIFVEITRGTPLLVQIYIYWYVFGQNLSRDYRFLAGALVLSLFEGAYISEIIRAGIESVGRSQWESGRAIGFTRPQIYRHVVFPQAIRRILPPLAGQFASIIKDSSLLSVLGISEFTLAAGEVNSFTFGVFESYVLVTVGYLVLTLPILLWTQSMENRSRYET